MPLPDDDQPPDPVAFRQARRAAGFAAPGETEGDTVESIVEQSRETRRLAEDVRRMVAQAEARDAELAALSEQRGSGQLSPWLAVLLIVVVLAVCATAVVLALLGA